MLWSPAYWRFEELLFYVDGVSLSTWCSVVKIFVNEARDQQASCVER